MATRKKKNRRLMGRFVKDTVSGYVGTVVSRCEYLEGRTEVAILAKVKDNTMPDLQWVPEWRVEEEKEHRALGLTGEKTK